MADKISVVINTYNAEKHLRRVLDSVKDFDEIVVCDMESTDNTVSIAQEYGCKIVTFEKKDYVSAEPARTFAIQHATNKWVLVIDADEIVTPKLREYLYYMIKEAECPVGLYLARKNFFMGKFMHCNYPDYILRFFIREKTEWPPFVHTMPIVVGRKEYISSKRKELALVHLAENTIRSRVEKTNLYTENELIKKADKHYGILALIFRPLYRFFKSYILKYGFLDGKAGFIYACYESFYQFVMVSKIIEKRVQAK